MVRLLIVDDEPEVGRALRRLLRAEFEVAIALGGAEALARLEAFDPDVVLSDFRMAGMNGVELLAEVRRRRPATRRVLLTGDTDPAVEAWVESLGANCPVLHKPWSDRELLALLRGGRTLRVVPEEAA